MNSLLTNWIRKKSDKSMLMPEIMYFRFNDAGGKYYYPKKDCEMYDMYGKPHSMKRGVIALNPKYPAIEEQIIAHEWRHHMQYHNGVDFSKTSSNINIQLFNKLPYEKALWKYFSDDQIELDAIRFQYKYSSVDDEWEEILYSLIKDFKPRPIITYGNNTITN